jgi:hypothetical protein
MVPIYGTIPVWYTRTTPMDHTMAIVPEVPGWYTIPVYVRTYVRTYTCTYTYNVMSQLSDWKRAHMCTHVCFGRIHGSQLREYVRTYHGSTYQWYVHVYVLIMLCHNFLIGKGYTCALRTTCVLGGYTARTYVQISKPTLEIQALSVYLTLPWYQWTNGTYTCTIGISKATICNRHTDTRYKQRADLHHNPRKHAHQRLHRTRAAPQTSLSRRNRTVLASSTENVHVFPLCT